MEPISLPIEKATLLFNKLSRKLQIGKETVKSLSFPVFAIGCIENNLFAPPSQFKFLQIKDESECLSKLQHLKPMERLKIIKERFLLMEKVRK